MEYDADLDMTSWDVVLHGDGNFDSPLFWMCALIFAAFFFYFYVYREDRKQDRK